MNYQIHTLEETKNKPPGNRKMQQNKIEGATGINDFRIHQILWSVSKLYLYKEFCPILIELTARREELCCNTPGGYILQPRKVQARGRQPILLDFVPKLIKQEY